jgi:hypothetical protein
MSQKYRTHGRRPPSRAAVCCGNAVCLEVARNGGEALAGAMSVLDPLHDVCGNGGRAADWCLRSFRASWSATLGDQPLHLVGGDQPSSPRHLDCLDERQHASIEGRPADSESLGRLRARICESFDARRLANDFDEGRGWLGGLVPPRLLAPASQAARHAYSVHKR